MMILIRCFLLAAAAVTSLAESDSTKTNPTIKVHYHVFIKSEEDGDDASDDILRKQTDILNEAYAGKASTHYPLDCNGEPLADGVDTTIRFEMAGVTRVYTNYDDAAINDGINAMSQDDLTAMYFDTYPDQFLTINKPVDEAAVNEVVEKIQAFTSLSNMDQFNQLYAEGTTFQPLFQMLGRASRANPGEVDCSTLNVWILSGDVLFQGSLFGVASKPHECAEGGMHAIGDGVALSRGALPDSDFETGNPNDLSITSYDIEKRGSTLVHEVGHWLNLEHVDFAGIFSQKTGLTGCSGAAGDFVADTPAMAMSPANYCALMEGKLPSEPCCPIGIDTCPHRLGEDPVRNFMGDASDCCTNTFSEGQAMRMLHAWEAYRAPDNEPVSVVETASTDASAASIRRYGVSVLLWAFVLHL